MLLLHNELGGSGDSHKLSKNMIDGRQGRYFDDYLGSLLADNDDRRNTITVIKVT